MTLLRTKATIPSDAPLLPSVAVSFAPVDPSQLRTNESTSRQASVSPARNAARFEVHYSSGSPKGEEMARLRTAPGSATRRSLVSMGPRMPDTAHEADAGRTVAPTGSQRPSTTSASIFHSAGGRAQSNLSHNTPAPANVEIMDLKYFSFIYLGCSLFLYCFIYSYAFFLLSPLLSTFISFFVFLFCLFVCLFICLFFVNVRSHTMYLYIYPFFLLVFLSFFFLSFR